MRTPVLVETYGINDITIAGTSSDITIQNIAVSGTTVSESPCATNSTWTNVDGAPTNCN